MAKLISTWGVLCEIVPVLLMMWLVCGEADKYLQHALCMLMCQEKENNADLIGLRFFYCRIAVTCL